MGWIQTVNQKVAVSPVGRWFKLEGSGHVRDTPTHSLSALVSGSTG